MIYVIMILELVQGFSDEHSAAPVLMVKEQFFVKYGHPRQPSTQIWREYIWGHEGEMEHKPIEPDQLKRN